MKCYKVRKKYKKEEEEERLAKKLLSFSETGNGMEARVEGSRKTRGITSRAKLACQPCSKR